MNRGWLKKQMQEASNMIEQLPPWMREPQVSSKPRYIVTIKMSKTEQWVVCTQFPGIVSGHCVPGQVEAEVLKKGSWTHPSGDFTIRAEGIYGYPDRYVVTVHTPKKNTVQIVDGFPYRIPGFVINADEVKSIVDTNGYYFLSKQAFIQKEGTHDAPTASPGSNKEDGSCSVSCEELRSDQGGVPHRTGRDRDQHDEDVAESGVLLRVLGRSDDSGTSGWLSSLDF